jgi:hypothetical protein
MPVLATAAAGGARASTSPAARNQGTWFACARGPCGGALADDSLMGRTYHSPAPSLRFDDASLIVGRLDRETGLLGIDAQTGATRYRLE